MTTSSEIKKEEIKKSLKIKENTYGSSKGYVIIGDAYHACDPNAEDTWEAPVTKLEGEELIVVNLRWDFTKYIKENGDTDDAGNYPFDDDELVSVVENETFNINETDYEGWI